MKKILSMVLALMLCLGAAAPMAGAEAARKTPKYVFMFIGDGQGGPQIAATQYYLGTQQNPDATMPTPAALSFTGFPYVGLMTTYDASSFCPDSASTATSMASGNKTLSGVINYNVDKTEAFKLITEYAKEAGKKVGVLTSVSIDHATPAAYYAKAESRGEYYNIAMQGVTGQTVDFLGGGGYLQPKGKEGDQDDVFEAAKANGFTVCDTNEAIRALGADSGRVLAVMQDPDNAFAMQYEVDRVRNVASGADSMSLAELTGIAVNALDNDNGFFMMVEGGKVDWSCHANDAKTSVMETLAFNDAVQVAVDFAAQHPDETLIVVTADHETGGLTIGFAATAYETHFDYLQQQDISFNDFDTVIKGLREDGATFEQALEAIQAHYGLTTEEGQGLTLTETEMSKLKDAYMLSMLPKDARQIGEAEELAYGGYEPLSMAVSHILNNKAGVAFTSYSHTGLQIPVYAQGIGAEAFGGMYDNTDIFAKTLAAMGLTADAAMDKAA